MSTPAHHIFRAFSFPTLPAFPPTKRPGNTGLNELYLENNSCGQSDSVSTSELPRKLLQTWCGLDFRSRTEFLHLFADHLSQSESSQFTTYLKTRHPTILNLPDELLVQIFSLVGPSSTPSLSHLALVCHRWSKIMRDEPLWRRLCLNYSYHHPISPASHAICNAYTHHLIICGNQKAFHASPIPFKSPTLWLRTFRYNHTIGRNWRRGSYAVSMIPSRQFGALCLKFTDEFALSVSPDRTATIWDVVRGRMMSRMEGGQGGMICSAAFVDGYLVTGCVDRVVKVWRVTTGRCEGTFVGHEGEVTAVKQEGDWIVSGSEDRTIRIWNKSEPAVARVTLRGHLGPVTCIDIIPLPHQHIVSGSADASLKIWDWKAASPRCLRTLRGHSGVIYCHQVDRTTCISGAEDAMIKVWDLTSGECKMSLHGHSGGVVCLQFDENKIVSGSADRTIKVWDRGNGACYYTIKQHTGTVWNLIFTSNKIISSEFNQSLMVYDFGYYARSKDDGVSSSYRKNSPRLDGVETSSVDDNESVVSDLDRSLP